MERIHYAGGTILTGTEISRALLQYAAALGRNDTSATVDLPVRDESGRLTQANVLIGPASQLVSFTEMSDDDEIVDENLVADLRVKTEQLGPRRAVAGELLEEDGLDELDSPLFGDET